MTTNAAIWLDHREARIFHLHDNATKETTVTAPGAEAHHQQPRGHEGSHEHPADAKHFFQDIARTVEGADKVLVVGPSTAKLDFLRYLHLHHHLLEPKVVGVETVDHPTNGQLVAYAKTYFGAQLMR